MASKTKTNKNILFYKQWTEETARLWLEKIFNSYDVNKDGFLERSEVNDWRQKTTHPKFYKPFATDDEWKEYLKVSFGLDLGAGDAKITLEQLFQIQKAVDQKAQYLGGNTLFTDIWHMLDLGVISDSGLVPHVVLRSKCSRCGEKKRLLDFRGVTADVRGQGGQWLKSDQERICVDCEAEQAFKSISRSFELNGIEVEYKFLWVPPAQGATERKEITKLFIDGSLVGHVDYQEEGRNYVARTFFDRKPVKVVTYFQLGDPLPRETLVGDVQKEAKAYFTALAKRAGTNTHELALILSDLFLFPNPYQVADIFGLDE
jgi:Ca2+-binding EF-hand superfamily protein